MASRSTPDGSPGSATLLTPITCAAASWSTLGLSGLCRTRRQTSEAKEPGLLNLQRTSPGFTSQSLCDKVPIGVTDAMHHNKPLAFATITGLGSLPLIYWLLCEAVVYYEMQATNAGTRAELQDDFGFGLLLFMIVLPGTAIGALTVFGLTWYFLRCGGAARSKG